LPGNLQQICPIQAGRRDANPHLPHVTWQMLAFTPLRPPFNALQCPHAAPIVPFEKAKSDYRL
jgi:hypothetical protein